MEDLFEREQKILEGALRQLQRMEHGASCSVNDYTVLVEEYRRLLKQLKRITKISDKTTIDLNASKLDLQDKVHYDELTGIYNRRFLEENLRRILCSRAYSGGMLSVMMIDVDFFKKYNDTYGHSMGDTCLRAVAKALKDSILRADDFVARYGGEEFVIVMPGTNEHGSNLMAERVLEHVRACRIPHEKNGEVQYVTVSAGVTTGEAEQAYTSEDYIKKADQAMYRSKQTGRNRSTFIKMEEEV